MGFPRGGGGGVRRGLGCGGVGGPFRVRTNPSIVASPQEGAALSEAQALHAAGRFSEASAVLERFVQTYPNSAFRGEARTLLGNIRLQENAYQDAVSILTEVVDQEPDSEFVDRARVDLATAHLALVHTKSAWRADVVVAFERPAWGGCRRTTG